MSKFSSLAELVQAVYLEGKNMVKDSRLIEHRAPTGINESTGADGGYLVTEEIGGSLLTCIQQKSRLYSRAVKFTTPSYSAGVPFVTETTRKSNDSGMLNAFWVGEGMEKTIDYPQFGKLGLKPHKLVVLMPATDEILEDSVLLQQWIDTFVGSKIAWEIDKAILTGNGTTSMYGIMSADTNGTIGVAEADPLDEATLKDFVEALAPACTENAEWFMSQENFQDVQDITFTNESDKEWINGVLYLFGKPVRIMEQMETPADLMLGDPTQYCVISRGPIQKAINISLRYSYDESKIRWVIRLNGKSFGSRYTLEDGSVVGTFVVPLDTPHFQSSSSGSSASSVSSLSSSSVSSLSSQSSGSSGSSASSASESSVGVTSVSTASSVSSESSLQSTGALVGCNEQYTASAFADTTLNGLYDFAGTYNGKPKYSLSATRKLWFSSTDVWVISDAYGSIPSSWLATADDDVRECPDGAYNGGIGSIA